MVVRYTGLREGQLPSIPVDAAYRFHLTLQDCNPEVYSAIDSMDLKIDVLDYKVRYYREAVHFENCGKNTSYVMQWRRFYKKIDFTNKGNDAFMVDISNIFDATKDTHLKFMDRFSNFPIFKIGQTTA